jgi:hypothetical protein
VALSDDVSRIAAAAAAHAAPDETVAAVVPVEPAAGERLYLCAFAGAGGSQAWLALDDDGVATTSRERVREAASIAALCEVAEETSEHGADDELRLASPSYLDALGRSRDMAGAIQGALPAVDELTRDLETNYKLELR